MLHAKIQIRRTAAAAVLFFSLLLSSCSWKIMYNYLDWILPWYLDDYVTLTDSQEKTFYRATLQFLDWHRSTELPRYAQFFQSLNDAQTSPMSREQVLTFFDEAAGLWSTLLEESMPDLLELATQLSDHQTKEMKDALAVEVDELRDKYGARTELEQRLYWRQTMTESLEEDWLGSVSEAQHQLIELWSTQRVNTIAGWLQYRDEWQKTFISLMESRKSLEFAADMKSFLLQPQKLYSSSYRQGAAQNRLLFAQFLADLSATLTPSQRIYLQNELAGIITDLDELNKQEG